jgi:uncharacterized membrane protein
MEIILTISLLLIIPGLLKFYEQSKFVSAISPVALAYAAGFALASMPLPIHRGSLIQATEISIALSISLLVLASSLDKFRVLLRPVLKSFLLGIASLVIAIFVTFYLVGSTSEYGARIMGMLTGVYVGGTPNLNAIGLALEVPNSVIVLVNSAEMVYGGIYFLLLITVIKPLLSIFLPKYISKGTEAIASDEIITERVSLGHFIMAGWSLLSSIGILGLSFGLVWLMLGKIHTAAFLIALTTLSILAAQLPIIKRIKWKFETAEFLLLIFSLGIGWQIDINTLLSEGMGIYLLVGAVFIGTITIHFFLAWITRTDVDTLMISSTAALYGPAFIAPIAKAINNRELIIYGIALGLLGYILGNYLGLGIAYILAML